ncbi:MAG TPA: GntR family transcriptional regulator [Puia sp.]|jgi:DNA-binding transcriptional regulator YhcF (GntR family)|nr:GntR family transcriptional regulator [Puia sp.]
MDLKINPDSNIPKYQQIADGLIGLIEAGVLKVGDKAPSIDTISKNNKVAKETVVQAYRHLKSNGIIESSEKRGFYIQTNVTNKRWRVLVLFNVMNPSKEIIYKSIVNSLGDRAHVELLFHNYNFEMFENIVKSKANMFHYYIIMPHFNPDSHKVLELIPPEKLLVLDRPLLHPIAGASAVYQDFRADVFDALLSQKERIRRYKQIVILFPKGKGLPTEIADGIKLFGTKNKMPVQVAAEVQPKMLVPDTLFITLTDEILIDLIELQQQSKLRIGKGIGIISYNENPLKRILAGGIATLTSDFEKMGRTAAECIINKSTIVTRNPFYLILRNSL